MVEITTFILKIEIDTLTLVLIRLFSYCATIDAKFISRLDIMKNRMVMDIALFIVATRTLSKINAVGSFGIIGTERGLEGGMLSIGIVANFI